MKLLTVANTKLAKNEKFGYLSVGLSLAPHRLNNKGYNLCPGSSESCRNTCLVFSGMNSFSVQSKIAKTDLFLSDKKALLLEVSKELDYYKIVAKKKNLYLTCRLNMYSDYPYEKDKIKDNKSIYELHPDIQFIEYTHVWNRFSKLPNLDITYSADKANNTTEHIVQRCQMGYNVSMVFYKQIPKEWNGIKVIEGDESDLRHLDEKGVIVALLYKNAIKKGFSNEKSIKNNSLVYEAILSSPS